MMTIIPYTRQGIMPRASEWLGAWGSQVLRTDIKQTDEAYLLETEMPGVSKDNIELIRENGVLTIAVKSAARGFPRWSAHPPRWRTPGSFWWGSWCCGR